MGTKKCAAYAAKGLGKMAFVAIVAVGLMGCDGDEKTICGVEYKTYGLLNKDERKVAEVKYELSAMKLIVGVLLAESVIAPVWFFGFDLYDPVGPNPATRTCQAT